MERRTLLKQAAGVAGIITLLPVMEQVVAQPVQAWTTMPPMPAYTPPPLDLRTPEQLFEDSQVQWAQSVVRDAESDWNKYGHFHYALPSDVYERMQILLIRENKPFETITIAGRTGLVYRGNVITRSV